MFKKYFWTLMFGSYAVLLIFLILRKKILLFLHPDFLPIVYGTVIILIIVALLILFLPHHKHHEHEVHSHTHDHPKHVSWKHIVLLLLPLIIGFTCDLRPLSSSAALERGLDTGALTLGRRQVKSSEFQSSPAKRTLYQWIITLSNNPEPTKHEGQEVHVKGFIINDPTLPADELQIARFIVTCCAADARVLSLPVKRNLPELQDIKNDTWVEITGKMAVKQKDNERTVIIDPKSVKIIPEPDNPYEL